MARGKAKAGKRDFRQDKEYRIELFKGLMKHLRAGFSLDCYGPLSESTINQLFKDYPDEFDKEKYEEAVRDAKQGWESIGRRQSEGSCLGNSRSWLYNMTNRYGWSDRQRVDVEGSQSVTVEVVRYSDKQARPTIDDSKDAR